MSKALSSAGMTDYSIDLPGQRVLVLTERTSDEVKETIEQTGKLAVLVGAGGGVLGAGVAMLGVGGDYFSDGPKERFLLIDLHQRP